MLMLATHNVSMQRNVPRACGEAERGKSEVGERTRLVHLLSMLDTTKAGMQTRLS